MNGLLDFVKTPEGQGLLGAAFAGMAGARKGRPWNTAGAAGYGGLLAFNQAEANQTTQALKDLQMADATRKQAQVQKQQDWFAGQNPRKQAVQSVLANGTGPTVENAAAIHQVDPKAQRLWEAADAGIISLEEYAQRSGKAPGKVARTVEAGDGKGGKRIVMVDDYGHEVGGFSGYVAPVQVNRGDRIEFALPTPGASFGVNMSPAERVAADQRQQGLNLQRESQSKPQLVDGQWVYQPTQQYPRGKTVPVEGLAPNGQASEGERKSAVLLQRMEGSLGQMNAALSPENGSPSAAKPELIPSAIRAVTFGNEALGNVATSGNRQRVEAAQLDILDAALTLGTGAAYTKEQLEGYRKSYFPQIGDSAAAVKDKQERLNNVIQAARIAAGRAAPRGAVSGWSAEEVK